VSSIPVAFAGMNLLQNGNFTQGADGLDGWTTESTDNDGLPITALVQVVNNSPDPNIAAMDVAPRGSDPLAFSPFTGLSQEFVAPADGGLEIGVDVSFGTSPDSGEAIDPNRSFDDGAIIIVVNQDDFIFIAEITEAGGVVMDPEGTIAAQGGNCTNTASTIPGLDRRLGCVFDIDVTTSQDATLDIGLENEGDGTIPFVLISNPTATPKSGNTPPVADAGLDRTVTKQPNIDLVIMLDGLASFDAEDKKNITYDWKAITPPFPRFFINVFSATPTVTFDSTGIFTFELNVMDTQGADDDTPDRVVITVTTNTAPTAMPTFMPTAPQTGDSVTLDANANDVDNDPLTFQWEVEDEDGNSVALDDPTSETPTFIPTESGTHTAIVTVDDGNGGTVTVSIPIPVTEAPTNNPPIVTITTPNGMVFVEAEIDPNNPNQLISGDPLVFTATATDVEDDNVALTKTIDWRLLDGKLVIFSQSKAGGTWNVMAKFGPGTLSPGVYVVEADVTDSDGNRATTSTIQFTVVPNTEQKVAPGFDMFETQPGTKFQGDDFNGEPLGSFDFDGTNNGAFSTSANGIQDTGTADTIVKRLEVASVPSTPDSDTIDIELVALQLVSVQPINLGAGLDFHYVTLQSIHGGPASLGMMEITFDDANGGTFDSFF